MEQATQLEKILISIAIPRTLLLDREIGSIKEEYIQIREFIPCAVRGESTHRIGEEVKYPHNNILTFQFNLHQNLKLDRIETHSFPLGPNSSFRTGCGLVQFLKLFASEPLYQLGTEFKNKF